MKSARQPWVCEPSLSPVPSPARAGEGCRRRGEGSFAALGYDLTPLLGLWNGHPKGEDFVS
jgi:hypothetical protein